jgi:nucleoside-diphosphate-sugar epimerase
VKYDHRVWREVWPKVMRNTIEACKRAGARLVFFDNVYPYGRVAGPMTEATPFNPCSRKGAVRAELATSLIAAWTSGALTGLIARSADFYGPHATNGVPNVLVFEPLSKQKKPSWLVNDAVPHSLTFTPDAALGLLELSGRASAWNQTWHLPTTAAPPTGTELIALACAEFGVPPRHRLLGRTMIRLAGWFDPLIAESYEMLYQSEAPYQFDSSKFAREFGFTGTPYADGVRATAASLRRRPAAQT